MIEKLADTYPLLDFLDIDNPEFPGRMVGPECDHEVSGENKLHVPSGIISLRVIAQLSRLARKLPQQLDQHLLPAVGQAHQEGGCLGRENGLLTG